MIETLTPPLRRAVSPYTGIVRSLEECLCPAEEPPLFRATCDIAPGGRTLGCSLEHLSGVGGAGRSRADAAAAAVGEALERYSATYVPHDRIVIATAAELGPEAVAPERFALFAQDQYALPDFPFPRFSAETPVAWVRGFSLPAHRPAWLPADLVFLGPPAGGLRVGYATSSGTACAESPADALERGLCEVLERDAFLIVWANRLSLPLLDTAGDESITALDGQLFAPTGLGYAAVDLSAFHRLPSVLGVVRAPAATTGALGVGAGTAATIERAWWKALAEAFASRAAGAKLALLDPERDYGGAGDDVVTFEDHIRYYADPARARSADFIDASRERTPVADVPRLEGSTPAGRVEALCRRVEAAGSSAYAVDVTSPDVAELGLTVTKVIAPELCSLDVPHTARFLGAQRLYRTAAELGLRPGPLGPAEVNPAPHPFP